MSDRAPSGGELARRFHVDVVEPLLAAAMPGLRYAAGRLGSGSDVLGLDDGMSRDHDWGCRLTLLVGEADRDEVPRISAPERCWPRSPTRPWPASRPGGIDRAVGQQSWSAVQPARRPALRAAYRAWAGLG